MRLSPPTLAAPILAAPTLAAPAAAEPIAELARQAADCRRCDLWRDATRTVLGEGPEHASMVLIGEQPGDREDLAGKPFVGPAGRVLDAALEEAGIARDDVYVTNAVKHVKFEPRGKRRIHRNPSAGEIDACRWWLDRELPRLRPKVVVRMPDAAAKQRERSRFIDDLRLALEVARAA